MVGEERRGSAIDSSVLQAVVEMIGADEPAAMLDLIDTYLQDSEQQVAELENALASGDYRTLHRMAHSMKSSSATFGATTLSKMCESLERSAKDNCGNEACAAEVDSIRTEHVRVSAALQSERARFEA